MYEMFFGMNQRPFSATPNCKCFVPVTTMRSALDELVVCAERGQGIGIVTAPAGVGKTLLCQKLAAEVRDTLQPVLLANATFPTSTSLLQAILYELHHLYSQMSEQELRLALITAVKQVQSDKQGVLVIVDEAHQLPDSLLEELRTLTNLSEDGQPLVRVVLSGDLSLEETLASPQLQALNQRICSQVTLERLTQQESAEYIAYRLDWAGTDIAQVFTAGAIEILCYASDGVPRCINQLADHSLLLAYVAEQRPVEEQTVLEALEDLKQLPLQWNDPTWLRDSQPGPAHDNPLEAAVAVDEVLPSVDTTVVDTMFEGEHLEAGNLDEPVIVSNDPGPVSSSAECIEVGAVDECHGFEFTGNAVETDSSLETHFHEVGEENHPLPAVEVGAERATPWPGEEDCMAGCEPSDAVSSQRIASGSSECDPSEPVLDEALGQAVVDKEPVDENAFEEEPVIDPYAALDAIQHASAVSGIVWEIGTTTDTSALTSVQSEPAPAGEPQPAAVETGPVCEPPSEDAVQLEKNEETAEEAEAMDGEAESTVEEIDERAILEPVECVSSHEMTEEVCDNTSSMMETVRDPRPDLIVEEVLPLLEESDGAWLYANPIPAPLTGPDVRAHLIAETALNTAEIEEQIGSDVLDMCLDTRQALLFETPDEQPDPSTGSAPQSSFSMGESLLTAEPVPDADRNGPDAPSSRANPPYSDEGLFDVVQPPQPESTDVERCDAFVRAQEARSSSNASEPERAGSTHDTCGSMHRPYAHLFSELRRRQTERL